MLKKSRVESWGPYAKHKTSVLIISMLNLPSNISPRWEMEEMWHENSALPWCLSSTSSEDSAKDWESPGVLGSAPKPLRSAELVLLGLKSSLKVKFCKNKENSVMGTHRVNERQACFQALICFTSVNFLQKRLDFGLVMMAFNWAQAEDAAPFESNWKLQALSSSDAGIGVVEKWFLSFSPRVQNSLSSVTAQRSDINKPICFDPNLWWGTEQVEKQDAVQRLSYQEQMATHIRKVVGAPLGKTAWGCLW